MVDPPTKNDIRILLGDATVDSWNQEKVTQWLEEKGWGQFASTFESKYRAHTHTHARI